MKTFLLPHDIGNIMKLLTDSEAGQIIKAVFDYEINSVEPEFTDRTLKIVFFDIKRFLDSNRENYEKLCKIRSESAKKRWEKYSLSKAEDATAKKDAGAYNCIHKDASKGNSNCNSNCNSNSNSDSNSNCNCNSNSNTVQTGLQGDCDTQTNKKAYGLFENVYLTDEEYSLVISRLDKGQQKLDSFSAYMRSSGKGYNDHYARLLSWNCYDGESYSAPHTAKAKKQPGERREPTFDVSEFTKKALNIKYVPPEE